MAPFPYRAVLFDKDGTLLDSLPLWAGLMDTVITETVVHFCPWLTTAQQETTATTLALDVGLVQGRPLPGAFVAGAHDKALHERLHRTLRELIGTDNRVPALPDFDSWIRTRVRDHIARNPLDPLPIPGVHHVLDTLRDRGIVLGIATSDHLAHTRAQLARTGLSAYWDWYGCVDTMPRPKPHGDGLRDFLVTFGLRGEDVLMLGDTTFDEDFARDGGAGAFWGMVHGGDGSFHPFASPDRILLSMEDFFLETAYDPLPARC